MSEMPILTVVIATRNDLQRLAPTMEGALTAFDGLAIDIFVVDGASTDGTTAFLDTLKGKPVGFVSEPDRGIYDAMNKGARLAAGDYIYFLNSGDLVTGSMEWSLVAQELVRRQPTWLVARVEHRGGAEATIVPSASNFSRGRLWLGRQAYNHQGVIFRTDVFNAVGGYDLSYGFMADLHLMLKFAVLSDPAYVREVVAVYEGGGVSAPLVRRTPRILHRARCELLDLTGVLRRLDGLYAFAQTVRRIGLLQSVRLWRDSSSGFSNPWLAGEDRTGSLDKQT